MSNLDAEPQVAVLEPGQPCTAIEVLEPRLVPLGGLRAMTVHRTLPQRRRSLIGAWCFLDHYGPDDIAETGGMRVPRHPHTGLATVSWLFSGRIEHLDSGGNAASVLPGELNLMIAGRGITHQEIGSSEVPVLHGVQLWYALPESTRFSENHFAHYEPAAVPVRGGSVRVFIGELLSSRSPVDTRTPELLGAEVLIEPGATLEIPLRRDFEYGVLAENADLSVNGLEVPHRALSYLPTGADTLVLRASVEADAPVRALLLGGVPLGEQIIMWWNFVGRDHDEIVEYRRRYQAELGFEQADPADAGKRPLFGEFPPGERPPIPAPPLPLSRLRPRS
ncbi:MAG: pirin family protein [Leucobacter sp.]